VRVVYPLTRVTFWGFTPLAKMKQLYMTRKSDAVKRLQAAPDHVRPSRRTDPNASSDVIERCHLFRQKRQREASDSRNLCDELDMSFDETRKALAVIDKKMEPRGRDVSREKEQKHVGKRTTEETDKEKERRESCAELANRLALDRKVAPIRRKAAVDGDASEVRKSWKKQEEREKRTLPCCTEVGEVMTGEEDESSLADESGKTPRGKKNGRSKDQHASDDEEDSSAMGSDGSS
jgi:hypothetical protein